MRGVMLIRSVERGYLVQVLPGLPCGRIAAPGVMVLKWMGDRSPAVAGQTFAVESLVGWLGQLLLSGLTLDLG
jgi:hypothetical protein